MEVNPFIQRIMNGEWVCSIPDRSREDIPPEEAEAYGIERDAYMHELFACLDKFKKDVLEECNLTDEPDVEKLYRHATENSRSGVLGMYDILADIAVERGLYEKMPWG